MYKDDIEMIDRVKDIIDYFYSRGPKWNEITDEEIWDIEGVLQLVEKQDKMIKLIAEEIKEQWNVELNVEYFRKKLENE